MAKKSNNKKYQESAFEDPSVTSAEPVTIVETDGGNPVIYHNDIDTLVEAELQKQYPEHVKYPTSTGLLQCILRELIRQRIGR